MNRLLLGMLLLLGGASARAALEPSPGQLDFQIQTVLTTSEPKATTLRNTGGQPVTVVAVGPLSAPLGVFARAGGSCGEVPFTVAPQGSCTIAHRFTPQSVFTYYETIRLTLAGGDYVDFGLRGEGDVGRLDISPALLIFSAIPVGTISDERTVVIQNVRQASVHVTAYTSTSVPAVSAFVRTGGSCPALPFDLHPQWSCTLAYTFAPTQVGESSMDVTIQTAGASGSFLFSLFGQGTPEIALFADGFETPALR